MAWASALALASSRLRAASSTRRSRSPKAASLRSRSCVLRLKASSIGLRKASQSFCSSRRSTGTRWAWACQRCCRSRTASRRSWGAAPSRVASSTIAWRSSKLCCCTASSGALALSMAACHSGCSSAKTLSPTCPAARHWSTNWLSSRAKPRQSSSSAVVLALAHCMMSSIMASRCKRCSIDSALTRSSQASTTLCASLQASSKRFHRPWLGAPP